MRRVLSAKIHREDGRVIMIDDSSQYYGNEPESTTSPWRWVAFAFILVTGLLAMYAAFYTSSADTILFNTIIIIPIFFFFIYAAYKWAKGEDIAPTDLDEDDRILASMQRHALTAVPVGGMDMYRCPDCQNSFELVNATPVGDKVVLCPFCDVRLYIE
ncbi:MAG: hypothetical protein RTU92_04855 [Candidatus Thorarchaeota archaeon]